MGGVALRPLQAMEPFFSVTAERRCSWASYVLQHLCMPVVLSLLPVQVGGVALCTLRRNEVTFNWPGFLAAMGSNVTFQSRNVFSKKFMGKKKARHRSSTTLPVLYNPRPNRRPLQLQRQSLLFICSVRSCPVCVTIPADYLCSGWQHACTRQGAAQSVMCQGSLDNINLFSIITILSFLLLTPVALLRDGGFLLTPGALHAWASSTPTPSSSAPSSPALCFHAYQQVQPAAIYLLPGCPHADAFYHHWRITDQLLCMHKSLRSRHQQWCTGPGLLSS